MTDQEINEALEKAARAPHQVDAALLKQIADSVASSSRPVRPLPPTWMLTGALLLVCTGVAFGGAARVGFYGIETLGLISSVLILLTLAILLWVTGEEFVAEMIPGSRHRLSPGALLALVSAALLAVFALVFRDYRTDHFVHAGIACLLTGLVHALPAAILCYLLLVRGCAMNPVAAGLVGGTLAGLAGVSMLELHCSNFQALHVLLWHTAVVPVSGVAGAAVGWVLRGRST